MLLKQGKNGLFHLDKTATERVYEGPDSEWVSPVSHNGRPDSENMSPTLHSERLHLKTCQRLQILTLTEHEHENGIRQTRVQKC